MQLPPIKISTSPAFYRWQPACWLRVSGPDAPGFLQGQFTNDLRLMQKQPAVYGLWLNVKGKVIADSFILRAGGAEEFWIGSYASSAAVIRERLESHVIADDVTIEDHTDAWAGVTLFGESAVGFVARDNHRGLVFPGRRARSGHVEWVGSPEAATELASELRGLRELDGDTLAVLRIRDGIPAIPIDVGPADLPNEGGLEADAISYSKGCYLGQEVMARLKSMGQIRRRLLRVSFSGAMPPLPAPLFVGERQVGQLRSVAREGADEFIGLAMVSRLNVTAESKLAFTVGAAPSVRLLDSP